MAVTAQEELIANLKGKSVIRVLFLAAKLHSPVLEKLEHARAVIDHHEIFEQMIFVAMLCKGFSWSNLKKNHEVDFCWCDDPFLVAFFKKGIRGHYNGKELAEQAERDNFESPESV